MTDKLTKVLSAVLGVPEENVTDVSNPDTFDTWDSMGHINLMMAIEAEFGVSFTPDEAVSMMSVSDIRKMLANKGVAIG